MQNGKFDLGDAITLPWRLPGGRNFIIKLLLWAAALQFLVFVFFGRGLIEAYSRFLVLLPEIEGQVDPDPEAAAEMLSLFGQMGGPFFFLMIFAWIITVAFETAIHKNALRGTDHGAFPFRFGIDEGRVMLAQFVVMLCVGVVYIVGIVLIVLITLAVASVSKGLSAVVALLLGIAYICALIIISVRLAPAAALSVRDNKQHVFSAFEVTKGHGWALFGSYAILIIAVMMVGQTMMYLGVFMSFGSMDAMNLMNGSVDNSDEILTTLGEQIKTPRVMIPLVFSVILYQIVNLFAYMHVYGVGNYMAQVDQAKTS